MGNGGVFEIVHKEMIFVTYNEWKNSEGTQYLFLTNWFCLALKDPTYKCVVH